MRTSILIVLVSAFSTAQSQTTAILSTILFDRSDARKPCPFLDCYRGEDECLWIKSLPTVWFINERGDSTSFEQFRNSLPNLGKGFIQLSIDWDGFIWKATLIAMDTTNYYQISPLEIAQSARATPAMRTEEYPMPVTISVPLFGQNQ